MLEVVQLVLCRYLEMTDLAAMLVGTHPTNLAGCILCLGISSLTGIAEQPTESISPAHPNQGCVL